MDEPAVTEATTDEQLRALAQEVAELRAEVTELRARPPDAVSRTAATGDDLAPMSRSGGGAVDGPGEIETRMDRRRLLRSLGTAAAAGTGLVVGASVLGATPAAANHLGGIGHSNSGVGFTSVSGSTDTLLPLFRLDQNGPGTALEVSSGQIGVVAESSSNHAIYGAIRTQSNDASAIYGRHDGAGNAVFGEVTSTFGSADAVLGIHRGPGTCVFGSKPAGVAGDAVVGSARSGRGVYGFSDSGIGVQAQGGRAPLLLEAAAVPGKPTTGAHVKGELYNDSAGDLWACVVDGTPGTWRKLGGPATAGAFHVLNAPVRVYDSRPNNPPTAIGPKTPLGFGVNRTIDLKANASTVPADATAVMLNILLVNAAVANGNFTVWANGAAKPAANTLVWGGSAARFSTLAVTKVDTAARCQVNASHTTDIVMDVVGYYR